MKQLNVDLLLTNVSNFHTFAKVRTVPQEAFYFRAVRACACVRDYTLKVC